MEQVLEGLRKLTRKKVTPDRLAEYFAEIGAVGNDRGMAILLATSVEDALQQAIAMHLRVSEDDSALFGSDSPLGTFDSKIRTGRALGIFGSETKRELVLVKAIRNAFAHSKTPMDFNTHEVAAATALLAMLPIYTGAPTPTIWAAQMMAYKKRPRFVLACQGLAHSLTAYARRCTELSLGGPEPLDEMSVVRVTPRPLP
jgi:hypothetical protein